jgi:hypothetical protein
LLHVATDNVSANRITSAAIAEWNTSDEVRELDRKGWKVVDKLPVDEFGVARPLSELCHSPRVGWIAPARSSPVLSSR